MTLHIYLSGSQDLKLVYNFIFTELSLHAYLRNTCQDKNWCRKIFFQSYIPFLMYFYRVKALTPCFSTESSTVFTAIRRKTILMCRVEADSGNAVFLF